MCKKECNRTQKVNFLFPICQRQNLALLKNASDVGSFITGYISGGRRMCAEKKDTNGNREKERGGEREKRERKK